MDYLVNIKSLNNRYFIIRHGESKANVEGIILSNPKEGILDYGLTDKGKNMIYKSILSYKNIIDNDVVIYSSYFKRAKETGDIIKKILGINKIHFSELLNERYFGNFEKTSNKNYDLVWKQDLIDQNKCFKNVESVNSVLERTTRLIFQLEKKYKNKKILLISHGDSLQILQTSFEMVSPSNHRKLKHLEVGEIKELKFHFNKN